VPDNSGERKPRQAVVIIHGIGEQTPMATLRGFVRAVTECRFSKKSAPDDQALSKPDYISATLELRRMAVAGNDRKWTPGDWVSTDFYELYWAHMMTGTAWRHVTAWAASLLLRFPNQVPDRLRTLWIVSWLAVVLAAVLFVFRDSMPQGTTWLAVLAGVVLLFKWKGRYFGLQYIGDAARYLSPTPENVGVRQAIRSAAVELLEGLHDDPTWRRYHRIILVGHSLGSVIGYDAITHLWQRRHHPLKVYPSVEQDAQAQYQEHQSQRRHFCTQQARALQSALWREQRQLGVQWKITDFITLGSPLAHASFLLATGRDDLVERIRQREYPSCPPQPEDHRDRQYNESLLQSASGAKVLHHGAPFACTRWTNLYFDRDFVGGCINDLGIWYGKHGQAERGENWIDNKPVPRKRACLFPHTKYWHKSADHSVLVNALDLVDWWKTPENTATALSAQDRDTKLFPTERDKWMRGPFRDKLRRDS